MPERFVCTLVQKGAILNTLHFLSFPVVYCCTALITSVVLRFSSIAGFVLANYCCFSFARFSFSSVKITLLPSVNGGLARDELTRSRPMTMKLQLTFERIARRVWSQLGTRHQET